MHDLLDNALSFGPISEWSNLLDQYDDLGDEWATLANTCTGSEDWSFD